MKRFWKADKIMVALMALLVLVTASACNPDTTEAPTTEPVTGDPNFSYEDLTEEVLMDDWLCYDYPGSLTFAYDGKGLVDYDNDIPDHPQDDMFSYFVNEDGLQVAGAPDIKSVAYNHINDTMAVVTTDRDEPYEFVRWDAFVDDPSGFGGTFSSAEGGILTVSQENLTLVVNGETVIDAAGYTLEADSVQSFIWEAKISSPDVYLFYNVVGGHVIVYVGDEVYYFTKHAEEPS